MQKVFGSLQGLNKPEGSFWNRLLGSLALGNCRIVVSAQFLQAEQAEFESMPVAFPSFPSSMPLSSNVRLRGHTSEGSHED